MFLSVLPVILAVSAVLEAAALRKSVKKTLYSYKNIGLTGGIIFNAVLIIAALGWITALRKDGVVSRREIFRLLLDFPEIFSRYALFVIIALCVALGISNIALIRHEGYHLHNALSILLAAAYIGGTFAIYAVTDFLNERVFTESLAAESRGVLLLRTAVPSFFLLLLCYFECILAGTAIIGYAAVKKSPPFDRDFIIILGCSIDKRGGLLPLLKGRVNRAIRFAWDQERETGIPVKYIPSGGQGPGEIISEGTAMEFYLLTHGAESYEVFPEKKSRSTFENMVCSRKVMEEMNPEAKIAFATTNYHVLRSGILARKAGMDAEGIAAPTKWYFWSNGFIREFFAILAMEKKTHVFVAAALFAACMICCMLVHF